MRPDQQVFCGVLAADELHQVHRVAARVEQIDAQPVRQQIRVSAAQQPVLGDRRQRRRPLRRRPARRELPRQLMLTARHTEDRRRPARDRQRQRLIGRRVAGVQRHHQIGRPAQRRRRRRLRLRDRRHRERQPLDPQRRRALAAAAHHVLAHVDAVQEKRRPAQPQRLRQDERQVRVAARQVEDPQRPRRLRPQQPVTGRPAQLREV
jgi:hypothetical protein